MLICKNNSFTINRHLHTYTHIHTHTKTCTHRPKHDSSVCVGWCFSSTATDATRKATEPLRISQRSLGAQTPINASGPPSRRCIHTVVRHIRNIRETRPVRHTHTHSVSTDFRVPRVLDASKRLCDPLELASARSGTDYLLNIHTERECSASAVVLKLLRHTTPATLWKSKSRTRCSSAAAGRSAWRRI